MQIKEEMTLENYKKQIKIILELQVLWLILIHIKMAK